jgi:hypothetical protein
MCEEAQFLGGYQTVVTEKFVSMNEPLIGDFL